MNLVTLIVLGAATVSTGLVAGLLFAFSCTVMPGLVGVDDDTFVRVMRSINVAVVNPWFISAAGGSLATSAAGLTLTLVSGPALETVWAGAATAGVLATVVITGGGNVPLNDRLAAAGPSGPGEVGDAASLRAAFEHRWVRLNHLRSITATGALACWVVASLTAARGT